MIRTSLAVVALLTGLATPFPDAAAQAPQTTRLRTYPEQVYFTDAIAKEKLSGTVLILIVEDPAGQATTPQALQLIYKRGGNVVRTDTLTGAALAAVDIPNFPPARMHSPDVARTVSWSHAYRLFIATPANVGVDAVEARLVPSGARSGEPVSLTIPVRAYQQKAKLIFPFVGLGIISQGGVLSSGHRNRSGLYAMDALGLSPNYGPMLNAGRDEDPANYAGWGREILAPAAGTVVFVRKDRPDQPVAEKSDPAFYAPEFPDGGDPGNHVVIDHGNGEFSMIAHLQKGSLRVAVGDRVSRGQVIGLLGNSGDTTGPHVHFQLMNGPDWQRADGLPARFENVESTDRGSYFTAR